MSRLVGKRVLVVDDDSLLALDLEIFLQDEGCVVAGPVPTVDAALALITAEPPDAGILDVDLSGENSGPIADALADRDVGFIFISGHDQTMVPATHADRPLLTKPWSEKDLRGLLLELLG